MKIYFQKRIAAFGYALKGIYWLFATQAHARIHAAAAAVITAMGVYFRIAPWEWCAIVGCMALVISLEALNTAIEFLADSVSREHHPLLGKAKDTAAAAVLLAVIFCGIIWGIIFLPKIFAQWA